MKLTHDGMVMNIPKSNQLTRGESGMMCTVWAPSVVNFSVPPGMNALADGSAQENPIDKLAESWWSTHSGGMPADVTWALQQALYPGKTHRNLYYWEIKPTIDNIRKAMRSGYIVLLTAYEGNVKDKRNGGRQAYGWVLGNHFFPVAGVDADGDFICPDQLIGQQGYWPPVYLANQLNPSYAVVVQVIGPDPNNPWLARIPSGDPNTWPANFNAQRFPVDGATPGLPKGAIDDGTTIKFSNGLVMVKGFRAKYLEMAKTGIIPDDDEPLVNEYACDPVEQSNPAWWGTSGTNKGSAQETRHFRFGYSPLKGVLVTYVGQELRWYQQQLTSAAH